VPRPAPLRPGASTLRVASFPPDPGGNPYLTLFEQALARRGIEQAPHQPLLTPAWARTAHRRVDAVHLHWVEYLYQRDAVKGLRKARSVWAGVYSEAALRLLARSPVNVVWTLHNLRHHEDSLPWTFQRVRTALDAAADLVICHSEDAAQRARAELGRQRPVVGAPHGHFLGVYPEPRRSRDEVRAALGLPADAWVHLSFGHVRPYKRVPDMIEAFRSDPDPNVRLLVAGRLLDHETERQVRSAIGDDARVVLRPGLVPDEEVAELHEAADSLVLNYRDLFSSSALLLGLSFGLPVVGADSGTLRETAPGLASVPFQPGGLTDALRRVRAGDAAASRAAALAAARACDWDRLAAAAEAGYRGALPSSAGQPDDPER